MYSLFQRPITACSVEACTKYLSKCSQLVPVGPPVDLFCRLHDEPKIWTVQYILLEADGEIVLKIS